jgi:hypothetical protein
MRIIRIPIGSTLNDKIKFIEEFLRVFPQNEQNKVEDIWNRQVQGGVLQMMIDVDTGVVTHVMRVGDNGLTFWELSSRFLNKIPLISDFRPEENPPMDVQQSFNVNNKTEYIIDDLLDIISEKGYDNLSDDQKSFLVKFSKKGS